MSDDEINRIVDDSINVTMPEYVELRRIFDIDGEVSFTEDLNRCQAACKLLGLPLSKMMGKEWRLVVVNNNVVKRPTLMNSEDIDHVLERFDQTDPALQREIVVELVKQIGALQTFKQYVHDRLDSMNVPNDPDPNRTRETGCRIGSRLNYVKKLIWE